MHNSKGGFLTEEGEGEKGREQVEREKARERARIQAGEEPGECDGEGDGVWDEADEGGGGGCSD